MGRPIRSTYVYMHKAHSGHIVYRGRVPHKLISVRHPPTSKEHWGNSPWGATKPKSANSAIYIYKYTLYICLYICTWQPMPPRRINNMRIQVTWKEILKCGFCGICTDTMQYKDKLYMYVHWRACAHSAMQLGINYVCFAHTVRVHCSASL